VKDPYQSRVHGSVRKNTLFQKFKKEDSLLGHVTRKPEERTVEKIFKNIPGGKRSVGEPRNGWLDNVKNDMKKTGVTGLKKKCLRTGTSVK
jgi:hypothetical protein